MARNVTAGAVHFRHGLNFFTVSNKPFMHSKVCRRKQKEKRKKNRKGGENGKTRNRGERKRGTKRTQGKGKAYI